MFILTYGFICVYTFSKIFSSVFIVFLYIFVFLFLISDSEGHKLKRACEISQAPLLPILKKEKSEQFESHQNVRIIQFYSNRRKTVKMMKSTFPNPNTAI